MQANDGGLPDALRAELAAEAFLHTASYDAAIATWMAKETASEDGPLPGVFGAPMRQEVVLRYGENPHQAAALYRPSGPASGLALAQQLQGKALSYNNYVDLDAAYAIARDLGETGVAVLKHTNPCGAARSATSLAEAYDLARACDPTSSFGGIVSTAGVIDEALAERLVGSFLEVILARDVTPQAREILAAKKNLRVLTLPEAGWQSETGELQPRSISGGLLVQQADLIEDVVRSSEVVTNRAPTEEEWEAMTFAWMVVRHVKSNAIIYARSDRTIGVGAGQMSRVDSSKIAVFKAQSSLQGTAVASDAFFPFADGVVAAAEAGATAVIQPGGSIRDAEVIEAANAHGLTMVLTGRRHFKH
jgi:phosphoribosylaminoimidazolecarboxamide formyltransferase/IMP cyclohydrolase